MYIVSKLLHPSLPSQIDIIFDELQHLKIHCSVFMLCENVIRKNIVECSFLEVFTEPK